MYVLSVRNIFFSNGVYLEIQIKLKAKRCGEREDRVD